MIDLEDAQAGVWIAAGKGIQTGAEQDVLADAALYGQGEGIFRIAAAADEKGAQAGGVGTVGAEGCALQFQGKGAAQDGYSERIVEDQRPIVKLMGGTAQSDAEGGAGWLSGLHGRDGRRDGLRSS